MECFEVTFFCLRDQTTEDSVQEMRRDILNAIQTPFSKMVESFDEPENDFIEICCSIDDCFFTEHTWRAFANHLADAVDALFGQYPELCITTGIFELTFDYTGRMESINEFTAEVLEKFPIAFVRSGSALDDSRTISRKKYAACRINEAAQQLY